MQDLYSKCVYRCFSCSILDWTVSDNSALLCSFLCIMLDSERVLFIAKCSCRIYDTLIIFVRNNNNNIVVVDSTA